MLLCTPLAVHCPSSRRRTLTLLFRLAVVVFVSVWKPFCTAQARTLLFRSKEHYTNNAGDHRTITKAKKVANQRTNLFIYFFLQPFEMMLNAGMQNRQK